MYDLIIKNGRIIDGTGSPSFLGDIAISEGRIMCVAKSLDGAKKIIDAKGLVVTPGFIDSHSHSDGNIITYPDQIEKIEQGITTSVGGQCGSTLYPARKEGAKESSILTEKFNTMGVFLEEVRSIEQGSNIALFVGHRAIRKSVMGMEDREPSVKELEEMKSLLRDAIEHGALGISFGLIYPPSCYAKTEELIALARVAAEYNALIAAHIRNEGDFLVKSTEEFIKIIEESGVRGVISHHKAMGKENWGKVNHTLRMIDEANAQGNEIYCDVYPYNASSTSVSVRFIPQEYHTGGSEGIVKLLSDPTERKKLKALNQEYWGNDLSWVLINHCPGYPQYEGMRVNEIAAIHGKDEYETVFDMIKDSNNICNAAFFTACEEDVETVLAYSRAMICTDAAVAGKNKAYHPRLRGSFPRVLGRYVRERKVTELHEMIRKMTSMPANVYGFKNKGLLAEGFDADICIFDCEKIIDCAEYTDCKKRAEGLNYVILGGEVVVENAVYNGKKMGKVILFKR